MSAKLHASNPALKTLLLTSALFAVAVQMASAALLTVTTTGNVYSVDETNGDATLIGSNAGARFEALAKHSDGTFYSNDWGNAFQTGSLTTINPNTGQKGADINSGNLFLTSLAFSSSDVLYALNDLSGPEQLVTVNTNTGALTNVGTRQIRSRALAFVGSSLYTWDDDFGLGTLNITTGAFTDVNASVAATVGLQGMGFANGVLYGVTGNSLYQVDTGSGVATLIGSDADVAGIYSGVEALAAVPEPSHALIGLACAGAAFAMRRRRDNGIAT